MALIRNSKPKKVSGGYKRVFGNEALGNLMSRVQSAVISSGNELEKLIRERTQHIEDLDSFLDQDVMPNGVFVASKKDMKSCKTLEFSGSEPDFIIFKREKNRQKCHLVELKDGDTFDTKKSSGERQSMYAFVSKNGGRLPYVVTVHFCCFNQDDRSEIVKGFKSRITIDEAMTGKEFCKLLRLDYEDIVKQREESVSDNLPFFLSELVKIEAVKNWLKRHFG